jgi:hypothetical protein
VEPIGALACIYVLRTLLHEVIRARGLVISGILLGLLVWINVRFVPLECVLFCASLQRLYHTPTFKNQRYYACFLIPVISLSALLEIYNLKVWGSLDPFVNELNDIHGKWHPVPPFSGMLGMVFDQEYGLCIAFPVFIFVFVGITLASKRQFIRYNTLMIAICLPYLLLSITFRDWYGDYAPTARFLYVLLPISSFYMAYALEHIRSILTWSVFAAAVTYGCTYNLLAFHRCFNGAVGRNTALMHIWLFHHRVTDFLPSMFLPHQAGLFVLWIGGYVGLGLLLVFSLRGGPEGSAQGLREIGVDGKAAPQPAVRVQMPPV